MADGYISVAIETDRAAIADAIYERFGDQVPGWEFQPAHPMSYLVEAFAEWIAELLERATEVPEGILRRLGWLFRVLPRDATQATGVSTWTFTSDEEYLIEEGTPVSILNSAGERVPFLVRASYPKAAGLFSTPVGAVELIAEIAGAAGTGLQTSARLEVPSITVDTITVEAPTTGGADGETDTEYLDRLSIYFGNRSEVLVRAINFETDAVVSIPQVSRALAINGYDADTATPGVGGHTTVAVVDADGLDPGGSIRDDGEAMQQAKSVAGLTIHWIGPTYTTVSIVFAGVAGSDYDPADVEARAEQAVLDYISPANHGLPAEGDQRLWVDRPIIRRQDIVTVLNDVLGFDYFHEEVSGTGNTTNLSPNLTSVAPTTGWKNGMLITGAGIPTGTRILSGAGTSTMVLSANATATAAGVAVKASGLALNGSLTADITLAGPAGLPAPAPTSTVVGTVTA